MSKEVRLLPTYEEFKDTPTDSLSAMDTKRAIKYLDAYVTQAVSPEWLPLTDEQWVGLAILCAKETSDDPLFLEFADIWLDGTHRYDDAIYNYDRKYLHGLWFSKRGASGAYTAAFCLYQGRHTSSPSVSWWNVSGAVQALEEYRPKVSIESLVLLAKKIPPAPMKLKTIPKVVLTGIRGFFSRWFRVNNVTK